MDRISFGSYFLNSIVKEIKFECDIDELNQFERQHGQGEKESQRCPQQLVKSLGQIPELGC
jgi:hypothetical protein